MAHWPIQLTSGVLKACLAFVSPANDVYHRIIADILVFPMVWELLTIDWWEFLRTISNELSDPPFDIEAPNY
jgi:hypothetical protein